MLLLLVQVQGRRELKSYARENEQQIFVGM